MSHNKALLKRLEKLDNKTLLIQAQQFKILNRVYSGSNFQRNYNTILLELDKRGLLQK